MAAKLRTSGKKKQPAMSLTSEDISDSVSAFLKAGGEIEQVPSGVSGQNGAKPTGTVSRKANA